ncbi:MAG: DegT/DnrJ/EryC1/StrS family aminotransferase [Pirellulaceae bacterium]|nr:DegT/DnrJ/EryC1/StrS family aminotransferase [Pirellulaceae bacterium]
MTQGNTAPPVPLLDVNRGNHQLRDEILAAITAVVDSGRFLHGPDVSALESDIAKMCAVPHAIGCASGSDALLLALMALELTAGDEVIVPSFTFFATASCADRLGCKLVFVDIDPRTYNMCPDALAAAITPRTRAIIPVHLFGQCARMDEICRIADRHDIPVIEDAAQAIGAAYHGRPACNWGSMGCLSFYPTKNLGGFGDGGMLTARNDHVADRLRLLASHGMRPRYYHQVVGINSRLDTIQAAVLVVKLRKLNDYTRARQANAARYAELFAQADHAEQFSLPYQDPAAHHVWNQFGIRVTGGQRDALKAYLQQQGIGCEVYYPVPLHEQKCFQHLGFASGSLPETERASQEILHLPIYPEMQVAEQDRVVSCIRQFYQQAYRRQAA